MYIESKLYDFKLLSLMENIKFPVVSLQVAPWSLYFIPF